MRKMLVMLQNDVCTLESVAVVQESTPGLHSMSDKDDHDTLRQQGHE